MRIIVLLTAVFALSLTGSAVAAQPPSASAASSRALRLSTAQAEREIAQWVGSGTTITRCWRLSRRSVECRYQTSAANFSIESTNITTALRWESWALARGSQVFSAPMNYAETAMK